MYSLLIDLNDACIKSIYDWVLDQISDPLNIPCIHDISICNSFYIQINEHQKRVYVNLKYWHLKEFPNNMHQLKFKI